MHLSSIMRGSWVVFMAALDHNEELFCDRADPINQCQR